MRRWARWHNRLLDDEAAYRAMSRRGPHELTLADIAGEDIERIEVLDEASPEWAPLREGLQQALRKDIDVAELYDCFTITPMLTLEDYGFCKPGQAGPFVAGGRVEIGGDLIG